MLIDGQKIANEILKDLKIRVEKLKKKGSNPTLAVFLIGDDKPSRIYVKKKEEAAKLIGLDFVCIKLPDETSKNNIIEHIKKIQKNVDVAGIIVQLPLPHPDYTDDVLNTIDKKRDVDCLTNINLGKLVMKTEFITPPTAGAVFAILNSLHINLKGKNVTVVGMGALVGKPVSIMAYNAYASVTTCNSETRDISDKCRIADIIITGVGKKDLIRGNMVKSGAIVIDTGISFEGKKIFGDVNVDEVKKIASYVTPTPGGVGPITVAQLLANTVTCAEQHKNL